MGVPMKQPWWDRDTDFEVFLCSSLLWWKGQTDWTPKGLVVSLEYNSHLRGFEVKVEDFPEVQPAFLRCWLMNHRVFFPGGSTFACISKMNEGTGGSKIYVTYSWPFEQSLSLNASEFSWRELSVHKMIIEEALRSKECLRLVISRYLLEYGAFSDLWHRCICWCHEGHWVWAAGGDFSCPAWCGHSSADFFGQFLSGQQIFFLKTTCSVFLCRLLLYKRVHTKLVVFFP